MTNQLVASIAGGRRSGVGVLVAEAVLEKLLEATAENAQRLFNVKFMK